MMNEPLNKLFVKIVKGSNFNFGVIKAKKICFINVGNFAWDVTLLK